MGPAILIPILVPLGFFALLGTLRYYQNVERMAMIERSNDPEALKPLTGRVKSNPFVSLKWSLVLIGIGSGLLLGTIIGAFLPDKFEEGFKGGIDFGLMMTLGGCGLFISYILEMSHKSRQKDSADQDLV